MKNTIPDNEVKIGDWYSCCCELDLYQIETEEHLTDALEWNIDNLEDTGCVWYYFWHTREEALEDLV